jgi:heme-degrading monooxygenase HmoA
MDDGFARLPDPPYWAVIFSSRRRGRTTPADDDAYRSAAARMEQLAAGRPGYLGIESTRDGEGLGITVSYWDSSEAIRAWRADAEHSLIRDRGRADWYEHYELRVARVERAYGWDDART